MSLVLDTTQRDKPFSRVFLWNKGTFLGGTQYGNRLFCIWVHRESLGRLSSKLAQMSARLTEAHFSMTIIQTISSLVYVSFRDTKPTKNKRIEKEREETKKSKKTVKFDVAVMK